MNVLKRVNVVADVVADAAANTVTTTQKDLAGATKRGRAAVFVAISIVTLLAACASPSPAPVLLTIPPSAAVAISAAAAATPDASASAPLLVVRRVNIPEYMVARRVRYRADPATMAEWPNTYWAERIEIGISREFVSALRQQLPGWALCDTNCGDLSPTLSLQIDLVPMDYVRSTQKLQARARITVSGPGALPVVLKTSESTYELPGSGDTAQSQAQTIATLIQQVAAAAGPMVRSTKQ
jgi:uncharacterized lipoprotein YmbA